MHHTLLDKHRDTLTNLAKAIGYTLEVRGEEGESYLWVALIAPYNITPNLSVDFSEKSGKFRFSTMLPVDRWFYPQKGYNHKGPATGDTNVSATNSPERIAGYVRKLIADQHDAHTAHLAYIRSSEDYYDKQMASLENLALMLEQHKPKVEGLYEKPNHQGTVKSRLYFHDKYGISVEVLGSGVNVSITGMDPSKAAKVIHEYLRKPNGSSH
jgi:hypothetical protein